MVTKFLVNPNNMKHEAMNTYKTNRDEQHGERIVLGSKKTNNGEHAVLKYYSDIECT